jgi:hypothetical protein
MIKQDIFAHPSKQRIASIDFWRGVYLLMIYVNHVPGNIFSYLTLRNWGFADSAEPFIFISGFSAMLAFGRYYEVGGFGIGLLRTLKRFWQLFCAHVLLVFAMSFVIAVAGEFTDSKPIMEQLNFSPFFVETDVAIVRLLKLGYMPNMTDILPLYIVMVFFFPVVWLFIRLSPFVALFASFSLWAWANLSGVSLPNYPDGFTWYFNPMAWQLVFVCGMVAYQCREKFRLFLASRVCLIASTAIVIFAALSAAPWSHFEAFSSWRIIPSWVLALDQKASLSWVRVVHFFALAYLAARLFPESSRFWKHRIVRVISVCGRHALAVFCVGIVLSLIVHILLQMAQVGHFFGSVIVLTGAGLLVLMSFVLDLASKKIKSVEASKKS